MRRELQKLNQLLADEFGVSGRNGFAKLAACHPVNTHSLSSDIKLVLTAGRMSMPPVSTLMAEDNEVVARMIPAAGRKQYNARLEETMPLNVDSRKGQTAKRNRILKGGTGYVLDNERQLGALQYLTHSLDKPGAIIREMTSGGGILLTWRARVNRIKPAHIYRWIQRVTLHEFKWITWLLLNINTDNIEPSAVVAHRGTARATEQIKQQWSFHTGIIAQAVST